MDETKEKAAMNTKEAIKKEFLKEYSRMPMNEITVKGLCAAVPVARTTFYSHYDNTDEVLKEIEDEIIAGVTGVSEEISDGNLPDMDFMAFMDAIEAYIREHLDVIEPLLIIQPDARFIRRWMDAIKDNFAKRYPERKDAKNFEAAAEIMASSVMSMYIYWMKHQDADPSSMKPVLINVLNTLVSSL